MPASRHDFAADRVCRTAQPLTHHRGLPVPRPPPQEMDAVDADPDFGMAAEVDQGVLGFGVTAAPASALARLAHHCLGLGAHYDSSASCEGIYPACYVPDESVGGRHQS